jgi:YVTN family beta-propeller protein
MSRRIVVFLVIMAIGVTPRFARATPFAYRPDGSVIDTATDTVVGGVSGINGQGGVAMNPAGTRVYLLHFGGTSGLKVIDTATNTVITTVSASPFGPVAVNPSGTRVYTANGGGNQLNVIDATTNTVITTVNLGTTDPIGGIAVHPDGSRVYVSIRFGLAVVDGATNALLTTVPGLAIQPAAVAVNPAGTRVYVGTFDYCGCGGGPTRTAIVDTATNTAIGSIPVYGGGLAINASGTRMYAADGSTVHVIDLATNTVVASVPGLDVAVGIAVNPAGTKVYAIQRNSSGTKVIDTATNTVTTTVAGFANSSTGVGLFIGPYCPGACSDGDVCTTDACNPVGGCVYTNNTAPCSDDGNACTTDVCDGAGACGHPATSSGTPCTDGFFCTGTDTCDGAGGCTNHTGDPCTGGSECADSCNEATDDCLDPVTNPCASDGNVCTDDHCNGAGACVHMANVAPCDDGLFCNGADVCAATICTHGGDPCTAGSECANVCNETADDCFDPSGSACAADANPCTLDQCDGAGSCAHPAGNAGTVCRSAAGQCDTVETCTGASTACPPDASQPDGFPCTDGNACTSPDVCTAGACTGGAAVVCALCETCDTSGGCIEAPRSGCKQPTKPLKASILLQDRMPDDLDQVKWKWSNGEATTFAELGDPLATHDYALCVYDASSSLLLRMTAPAGGTCGTKPCWKQLGPPTLGKGYKYKDVDGLPHDVDSMTLKAGLDGKAKMSLKAKGSNIPLPALGFLALPLTTQLQSRNGQCYEATTTTPSVNTTALFKAKAD